MTDTANNLEELLRAEYERHVARLTKLRRAAAAERRRVDAKVVDLLRETKPDLYARLAEQAVQSLAAEKAKRSNRAKSAAPQEAPAPEPPTSQAPAPASTGGVSWNG